MLNPRLHYLLREGRTAEGQRLTASRLATAVGSERSHVTRVLNNTADRGHFTRRKIATWLLAHHQKHAVEILKLLGWDSHGKLVPRGECQKTERQLAHLHD